MYGCDTGTMRKIVPNGEHLIHIPMSVEEAQRIAHSMGVVRQDPEHANGEINIVIIGKVIKKIRVVLDNFYENLSQKKGNR